MDRYYKIAKDSETGKKFAELVDKYEDFLQERNKFFDKYAIKAFYTYGQFWACVSEVVFKDIKSATKDNWKKGSEKDSFILKTYPKDKELKKDWDNLQSKRIGRYAIDKIVGGQNPFNRCGFYFSEGDFFLIVVGHPEEYDFPSDVIEISNIEYLELTKQK